MGTVYVATAVMSGVRLWDGSSWRAMVKPTADREMPSPVAHKVDTVRMVYATTGPSKQEQGRNQACGEEDMFGDWVRAWAWESGWRHTTARDAASNGAGRAK